MERAKNFFAAVGKRRPRKRPARARNLLLFPAPEPVRAGPALPGLPIPRSRAPAPAPLSAPTARTSRPSDSRPGQAWSFRRRPAPPPSASSADSGSGGSSLEILFHQGGGRPKIAPPGAPRGFPRKGAPKRISGFWRKDNDHKELSRPLENDPAGAASGELTAGEKSGGARRGRG
jgi:hypothetical protein